MSGTENVYARNLINGTLVDTVERLDVTDPSTGAAIGSIPLSNERDVNSAVEAAKAAFPEWSNMAPRKRSAYLIRIAELIEENMEELALLESRDSGKPLSACKIVDIPRAATNFRYFAEAIVSPQLDRVNSQGNLVSVATRTPVGVAGLISPWNFPIYLLSWKIAPAVAYGNTCVAKPSEVTSLSAFRLAELIIQAGLPKGVINIVFGDGQNCGEPLVLHEDVDIISFTGSTAIGSRILKVTAPQVKKVSLELGGKNPAVVFEDCDIDAAVSGCVRSAFTNQGEVCLCTERTFVHESIYDEFLEKFLVEAEKWIVGPPRDPKTKVGALVSAPHFNKVTSMFEIAKRENFIVFGHGLQELNLPEENQKGYFVSPTVLTNVPDDHILFKEEVFGPVTAITKFSTEAEVIQRANDSKYGLCGTIWTKDLAKANRVARKIKAGTIWINCWLIRDLNMPFGGMKRSGIGRESGFDSHEFFTEAQCISTLH